MLLPILADDVIVYTSEIFPSHIRAKGMSASIVAYFASLIIYLEVAPTAFADVRWHSVFLRLIISQFKIDIIMPQLLSLCRLRSISLQA